MTLELVFKLANQNSPYTLPPPAPCKGCDPWKGEKVSLRIKLYQQYRNFRVFCGVVVNLDCILVLGPLIVKTWGLTQP